MRLSLKQENQSKDEKIHHLAIIAEQTSQIYAAVNNAIIATIINSIILIVVLWPVIQHEILLLWLISILLVSFARGILAYRFKTATPSPDNMHLWTQRFLLGSIIASIIWGASSIWLFPSDDLARQVFLAFVVGGMAAGAITSLSYIKFAIYSYLGLTLIPLLIRFFYSETELSVAMGSMLILYYVALLQSAKQSYFKSKENILMRTNNLEHQRSLNQSEHRYETLIETASDAFFLHDFDGNILDVNNLACRSLGYTREELLSMSVFDVVVGSSLEKSNVLWGKLNEGENIFVEDIHRRKDGTSFPVEAGIGFVRMGYDSLISVMARDVTERKRIEKMKNEFISTVSHELRTPLTSIKGSLGLMCGGAVGELTEEAQKMLAVASNNAERLLFLINDILDIQKIESGELEMEFEKMDIVPFLKQAVNENLAYAEQYEVSYILEPMKEPLLVYANKDRLMQVMANLLSNAAKFSHKNGSIEISAAPHDIDTIRISVVDHGQGIPEEFYSKIFDKFTQLDSSDSRNKGGTGLGLNISKAIIEKHGGEIGFVSKLDVETTFYFDLPMFVIKEDKQ